jgi:hypothetical protein
VALTDPQKTNIRRHLGVPVAGQLALSTPSGTLADGNAGYRYFDAWGQLEYRMNRLNPDEEARLLGYSVGILGLAGPTVYSAGVTFSFTITSTGAAWSPATISYTTVNEDTNISVLTALSQAINQTAALTAAGFYANNAYIFQPSGVTIPLPQMEIVNSAQLTFGVTVTSTTNPMLIAYQQGVLLSPSFTASITTQPPTVIYGYSNICDWLEGAWPGATQNLDTARADSWYSFAMFEQDERERLYNKWCMHMADFLFGKGAWTGPAGKPGGSYTLRGSIA